MKVNKNELRALADDMADERRDQDELLRMEQANQWDKVERHIVSSICLFNEVAYQSRVKSLTREQGQGVQQFMSHPIRVKVGIERDRLDEVRETLNHYHPNFKAVTDAIMDDLFLASLSATKGISFQPLLLVGEPGIGKTYYTNRLSELLSIPNISIDFSTTTSGFVLSGTCSKWGNSSAGAIAKLLMTNDVANGLVLIDEIDKAGDSPSTGSAPVNCLLSLLEKHSAKQFKDEFIEVPIDASHLNYIATANDVSQLPSQILSRFTVFKVEKPSGKEVEAIAQQVYKNSLIEMEIDSIFADELATDVVKAISASDVRSLKKTIMKSIVSAAKEGREQITLDDLNALPETAPETSRRMGFL